MFAELGPHPVKVQHPTKTVAQFQQELSDCERQALDNPAIRIDDSENQCDFIVDCMLGKEWETY